VKLEGTPAPELPAAKAAQPLPAPVLVAPRCGSNCMNRPHGGNSSLLQALYDWLTT
jgi:hypothetical protein